MKRSPNTVFLLIVVAVGMVAGWRAVAFSQPAGGDSPSTSPRARSREFGSLEVVVTYSGLMPKDRIPDDTGVRRDLLKVHQPTGGLCNAVVSLRVAEAKDTEAAKPAERGDQAQAEEPALVIDQRDFYFVPRVAAVRAGRLVKFTNSDPANHNVRSASLQEKNQFNVLTGSGDDYKHRFLADSKERPILLGCDIHAWMTAWIYVFDHPYFAVTNDQGTAVLADLPPGPQRLVVRQPDAGFQTERDVQIEAGQRTRVEIKFSNATSASADAIAPPPSERRLT